MNCAESCPRISQVWEYLSEEENQPYVADTARAWIGIAAVYQAPIFALGGAAAAGFCRGKTEWVLGHYDSLVNMTWEKLDHNQKMVATGLALAVGAGIIHYVPVAGPVCSIVATCLAAKVGAEMALRHGSSQPSFPELRFMGSRRL